MRVRVVFFGILKDLAGCAAQELELPANATAADAWAILSRQHVTFERFAGSVAIAVNHHYSSGDTVLKQSDEIALLPPVSGGLGSTGDGMVPASVVQLPLETAHCRLQRDLIRADRVVDPLKRGEDGAVCVFDGVVRNNTRGRRTLYLEYEAYAEMAIAQMEQLAVDALARFSVRSVRLVHRVGRLEIGDTSVLIVVASAHRAAAFDACRWLIDTLKRTAPVWKKEYFEDGAVWADGEPFPPEIPTAGK